MSFRILEEAVVVAICIGRWEWSIWWNYKKGPGLVGKRDEATGFWEISWLAGEKYHRRFLAFREPPVKLRDTKTFVVVESPNLAHHVL
jgi:hypothetical protein